MKMYMQRNGYARHKLLDFTDYISYA